MKNLDVCPIFCKQYSKEFVEDDQVHLKYFRVRIKLENFWAGWHVGICQSVGQVYYKHNYLIDACQVHPERVKNSYFLVPY